MSNTVTMALALFGLSALASFLAAFVSLRLALRFRINKLVLRRRDIHREPVPLLGGVGIAVVLIACFGFLLWLLANGLIQPDRHIGFMPILGFLNGIVILLIGGILDDRYDLSPRAQIVFPILAALSVVASGTAVNEVTNWFGGAPISLGWFGVPLAFVWIIVVTYAIKFFDGLDGLVSGQVVIGATLIALLSLTTPYYQPIVAFMAVIVAGSYLGFLPHNFHPAKQFLGESGSLIAGFSLAFLSIVGGAKLATGLMALGFPLVDAVFVVIGRLSRGASPFKGDDTHLHFKLLRAGLSQRQVVFLIWGLSGATGAAALGLQSVGKAALLVWIILAVLGLSAWAGWQHKRKTHE